MTTKQWFRKLLGKDDQAKVTRFEVIYREQVYCKTDKEAARHVLNKLRTQHVELMVKQFTSKIGDDDKAILTFVKTGDPMLRPLLCTECGSIYGKAAGLPITESEITETKTTITRL